jgi:hypothetical protein
VCTTHRRCPTNCCWQRVSQKGKMLSTGSVVKLIFIFFLSILFVTSEAFVVAPLPTSPTSKTASCPRRCQLGPHAAKKTKNEKQETTSPGRMDTTTSTSPGTWIAAPFVILVGLDLVLNLLVVCKRTIEFVLFGKAPSTEVWFSDNFFM